MTSSNKFRAMLESQRLAMGLSVSIPSEFVVDLIGYSGFDFVFVGYHFPHIDSLIRAAEAAGMPSLIRVTGPKADPGMLSKLLDLGANGVLLSRVSTREEAESIVRMSKIPPIGEREVTPGARIGRYWSLPMAEFERLVNDTVVAIFIETKEGLANAEQILSVPGIDMVTVGQSDLSRSLDVRRDDPMIRDAQSRIFNIARANGVTPMAVVMSAEELGEVFQRDGVRVFQIATDGTQISRAFRDLVRRSAELVADAANEPIEGTDRSAVGVSRPWLTPTAPRS